MAATILRSGVVVTDSNCACCSRSNLVTTKWQCPALTAPRTLLTDTCGVYIKPKCLQGERMHLFGADVVLTLQDIAARVRARPTSGCPACASYFLLAVVLLCRTPCRDWRALGLEPCCIDIIRKLQDAITRT